MHLFWRHGYDGTSLGQLTSEMGIAAPSLYSAFGSKENLFKLALDRYFQTISSQATVEFGNADTAYEGLQNVLRASAISFSDPASPFGCMIGIGALQCSSANQAIKHATSKLRNQSYSELLSVLSHAQSVGEIGDAENVALIADYYSGVVYGMSVLANDGASQERLLGMTEMAMTAWPQNDQ